MILSAALASPARQASTTRASRLGWTRSPINSIEEFGGVGCSGQTASWTHLWGKTQRLRFLDHICTVESVAQAVRHAVEECPLLRRLQPSGERRRQAAVSE